jgi:hypothetical protein
VKRGSSVGKTARTVQASIAPPHLAIPLSVDISDFADRASLENDVFGAVAEVFENVAAHRRSPLLT